ncbi:MAG: radical SAM/SPASM domain-containing protein [Candidatus Omnitrophica bacterium]|nr:radical SAM/SPASM domain-containing protein [Candidatus Omnitrophota bacterium]
MAASAQFKTRVGGNMIPETNEIRFEVTTRCNYNCIICPREKLTRNIETMSFELFKNLLDKILLEETRFDTVAFPGLGEPLLDKTLDAKIAYSKKAGFKILILSNGSLLTLERFKELEGLGVDSIRVSIYGDSANEYSQFHGVKNLDLFGKVKRHLTLIAAHKRNTKLLLTYNVLDDINGKNINLWIDYWKDKADLIEVWRPHNWVDGRNYRKAQKDKIKSCGRPYRGPLQIQVDGTVNMCCFDFNGKLTLGDLKTQTLKQIFSSPMFKEILKHHKSGNFKNSGLICANCDQRNKDKSDVMIYNSKFDIAERVNMVSTVYSKLV